MAEFSFEQDVAPYASKFFARVESNPLLSTAKKTQLTGDLLDKLEGVKKIADEDSERSLQMEMRRTQLDRERLALDDARMEFQKKREAAELEPIVSTEFDKLLSEVSDPREQQRQVGLFAMRNSDVISRSPSLAFKYRSALSSIAKPSITPYQQYTAARQAEKDKVDTLLKIRTEERREATAKAKAAESAQKRLDSLFDVDFAIDEAETSKALAEKREAIPRLKNTADRFKLLDFIAESGGDPTALESASDFEVFKAARQARTARENPAAPRAPIVDFK